MNRITVSLLAALDAVIALGVGVAIPLVPLTVLWGMQLDSAADWTPFWRAASDIWLLGHGVDVTVTLDPAASAVFGLTGTNVFPVTIAALGFALLTAVLGSRTGRRAWATPHALTAAIAGVAVFGVLSALLTLSAHTGPVVPSLLQGSLLPASVFALGIGVGLAAAELKDRSDPENPRADQPRWLPWPFARWSSSTRAVLAAGLRGGIAASLLVIAASAVVLSVLLAIGYGRVVALYEALQPGALGASALTLAQLALLPNAVIWMASWLAGPGFAVGTGSAVDVTQTALGPLPNVPLLGVLPQGDPAFGLVAVLVPVLCGAIAGFLTRQRLDRMPAPRTVRSYASQSGWGAGRLTLVTLGVAVCAGAVLGLLAWWSAGAIGPGRLQHAGPSGLLVAGAVAVEVLVGSAIGIAVRRQPDSTARVSLRDRRAHDAGAADPLPDSGPEPVPEPISLLDRLGFEPHLAEPFSSDRVPGPEMTPIREPEPTTEPIPVVKERGRTPPVPAPSDVRAPERRVPQRPAPPRMQTSRSRSSASSGASKDRDATWATPDFARHEGDE